MFDQPMENEYLKGNLGSRSAEHAVLQSRVKLEEGRMREDCRLGGLVHRCTFVRRYGYPN